MRRKLWVCFFLFESMLCLAVPEFKYEGCVPESGSEISSFDFALVFNYDSVIAELGEGEYGIGWYGSYIEYSPAGNQSVQLYEGDKNNGKFLGRTLTWDCSGTSDDFKTGNKVNISFPGIIPKEGQKYTIYISNVFHVRRKGENTLLKTNSINFGPEGDEEKNLVLTFIGKTHPSDSLALVAASLTPQSKLARLSSVSYTFNNPVSVDPGKNVSLWEGENRVAVSRRCEVQNENMLIAYFDDVELLRSRQYLLCLPESIVTMKGNESLTNRSFEIMVTGVLQKALEITKVLPEVESHPIPDAITTEFDIPDGFNFSNISSADPKYKAGFYKTSVSEENLVKTVGAEVSGPNTLIWRLPEIEYKPCEVYILNAPARQFRIYDSDGKYRPEYTNEKIDITYTLPTAEEADLPPLTLGKLMLGDYSDGKEYIEGMKLPYIDNLVAKPEGAYVTCENTWESYADLKINDKIYLYEITDEGDVLVKTGQVYTVYVSDEALGHYEARLAIPAALYEGCRYRLVIPEGALTVADKRLAHYVWNREISYTFEGTAPKGVRCLDCSLKEGETVSRLYNVMMTFDGDVDFAEGARAYLKVRPKNWPGALNIPVPLYKTDSGLQTLIHALCMLRGGGEGEPYDMKDGSTGTFVLPAGTVHLAQDSSVTNDEISISFIGKDYVDVREPEFVNITLTVNGEYSTMQRFVKGERFEIQLGHEDWEVEKLMRFNGADDTEGTDISIYLDNGLYKSSAVETDTRYELTLRYARPLVFADASGVAALPASSVRIYSKDGDLLIDGLSGGEEIIVYSTGGLTIATHRAAAGADTVRISLEPDTYIVRVKGRGADESARILHTLRQ